MKSQQKKIFLDICGGFTHTKFQGRDLYLKHLGEREQIRLDDHEAEWKERILKIGVPTREQKLKLANLEGSWTTEQENQFQRKQKEFLRYFNKKPKFRSIEQIDGFFESIEEMKGELIIFGLPRTQAIGTCAEDNASFEAYNQEIYESCFADPDLTVPFFEDYDYLEEKTALELHNLYFDKIAILRIDSLKMIKQICCQDFFYNKFCISDNSFFFLNKPLWTLTTLQTYLISLGRRYSEVLKYCQNAPDRFYDEPDKLECYAVMIQERGQDDGDSGSDMLNQVKKARRE